MITLSPETEKLARLVAARRGKTPEEILKEGVETEARIAGVAVAASSASGKEIDVARVRDIARRIASRPLHDKRSPRDIRDDAWGTIG
jgi:plasmid stability protein